MLLQLTSHFNVPEYDAAAHGLRVPSSNPEVDNLAMKLDHTLDIRSAIGVSRHVQAQVGMALHEC